MKASRIGRRITAVALLVLSATQGRAANVVACDPTDGQTSIVTLSPAMVNNVSPDAPLGLKVSTTIDGCVANAPQLDAWVASKNGTSGLVASMATKALVSVKAKGFGTCNFATPNLGAYPTNGSLSIKWLNSDGSTNKMKGSKAAVRITGDLGTVSAIARGIITKGTGVGADVMVQIGFDLANPVNGPLLACNTGPYAGPSVSQIGLITSPSSILTIDFP